MAGTHFYNNIRYFCDFKLYIFIVIARDTRAEIHGYGNINLAIKVHRQNMVPFQWPQWLVVDAIGAQLRSFSNSTD